MARTALPDQGSEQPRILLTARLILVIVVASLPFFALLIHDAYVQRQQGRDQLLDEAQRIAGLIAAEQDGLVESARTVLAAMAAAPSVQTGRVDECREFLTRLLDGLPAVRSLAAARPDGTVWCSSSGRGIGLNVLSRAYIREAMAQRHVTASGYIIGLRTATVPTLDFAAPVIGPDGELLGAVLVAYTLERVEGPTAAVERPADSEVVITDRGGTVLLTTVDPQAWTGKIIADTPLGALMGRHAKGTAPGIGGRYDRAFGTAAVASPADFVVAVGLLQESAYGAIDRRFAGTVAVFAAVLLAIAAAALLVADAVIRRPVLALRESEERFGLLVQGVKDYAILMLDPDGRVVSWNDGAERIEGYRPDEIIGRPASVFYPPEARAAGEPERLLADAAAQGAVESEGWRVRKDGSRFWAAVAVTALRNADGSLRGFGKITRDLTEQRQHQEALDRSREALAQAQKMEAVGHLTGGVAHDFNNLLTAILGNLEMLERNPDAAPGGGTARLVAGAKRAAEQGAALTQRLLAFSRRQALNPQAVDVNRLVGGMSDLLRRTLGENIAIETVLAGGLWQARLDVNQFQSALLNLAVNARDAMQAGGRLTIETGNSYLDEAYVAAHADVTPGQYVMVAVTDTGVGMSKDTMEHAFDPFYTTKAEGHGTGLGLSQVFGFIKQSGGHVKLYSEVGQGTTVKVYLLRHLGTKPPPPPPERQHSVATARRGETVLLVEDDANVREFSANALDHLGYRVVEAGDAAAALERLGQFPEIAVLFTDVGLPGVNGRQLAEEAKRRAPHLKILFTTGYARNAIVHNGVLDHGVELLAKPFTVEALGRRLNEMLRG